MAANPSAHRQHQSYNPRKSSNHHVNPISSPNKGSDEDNYYREDDQQDEEVKEEQEEDEQESEDQNHHYNDPTRSRTHLSNNYPQQPISNLKHKG